VRRRISAALLESVSLNAASNSSFSVQVDVRFDVQFDVQFDAQFGASASPATLAGQYLQGNI
jgi:hypothetical protein